MTELGISPQLYFLATKYGIKPDKNLNIFALASKIIKVAAADFDYQTLQLALLYLLARGYETVTSSSIHIIPPEYDIVYVFVYDPDDDKANPGRREAIKPILIPSQDFHSCLLLVFFLIPPIPKIESKLLPFTRGEITLSTIKEVFTIQAYRVLWDGKSPLLQPLPQDKTLYILKEYLFSAIKRDLPIAVAVYLIKRRRKSPEHFQKLLAAAEVETQETVAVEDVGDEEAEEEKIEVGDEEAETSEREEIDITQAVEEALKKRSNKK